MLNPQDFHYTTFYFKILTSTHDPVDHLPSTLTLFFFDGPICDWPSAPSYMAELGWAGFNPWHEEALPDYRQTSGWMGWL